MTTFFINHYRMCCGIRPLRIKRPSPEAQWNFCNWQKTQGCSLFVYGDFEASLITEEKRMGCTTVVVENYLQTCFGAVSVDSRSNRDAKGSVYSRANSLYFSSGCFRSWLTFCVGEDRKYSDLRNVSHKGTGAFFEVFLLKMVFQQQKSDIESDAFSHHG